LGVNIHKTTIYSRLLKKIILFSSLSQFPPANQYHRGMNRLGSMNMTKLQRERYCRDTLQGKGQGEQ